ncbi:type IV secretion system protein [Glycomyces sp. NPDC047369]
MPEWLEEVLDALLEWVRSGLGWIRDGLSGVLTDLDWIHLSSLSWDSGQPLADEFLAIAVIGYGLVVVVGGVLVMSHETLQTRYTIREIAPRLVVGLLLAGLSMTIVQQAMEAANNIVDGFSTVSEDSSISPITQLEEFPTQLDSKYWLDAQLEYEDCVSSNGEEACEKPNLLAEILWILATTVCLAVLLFTAIVRNIAFFFVVVLAPIALACHGLPVTEWAANLWWRMLGACMASAIGQAALVWVWVKMTSGFYWGHFFHILVTDLYLLVIVWMIWKVHEQAFRIARGRPMHLPGSRLLGAVLMSKSISAAKGPQPSIKVGDKAWGIDMRRPFAKADPAPAADRFPDLPPEPEGFDDWVDFRNTTDARRSTAPDTPASSPHADAAPVSAEGGGPVRVRPVRYPLGGRRPVDAGAPSDSPLGDAGPDTVPSEDSLAQVPDGTLMPRRAHEPARVTVRTDEVDMLESRRNEAELDHWILDSERAERESAARDAAQERQAELRRGAAAAMARMAAAPARPVPATPPRPDQEPPSEPERGERR